MTKIYQVNQNLSINYCMKNLLLVFALFLSFTAISQTLKLADDQFEGYIIDEKGTKYEGVIEMSSTGAKPWANQDEVTFIEKKVVEAANGGKINKKDKKKFDAKEVKEYMIGSRKFVTVKYTNIQGAMKSSGGSRFNAIAGAAKNLGKNEFMVEVIVEGGKMSLYRMYNSPPPVSLTMGDANAAEAQRVEEECIGMYDIVYLKVGGKDKAKAIARPGELSEGKQMFRDVIEDCKVIEKKFDEGAYVMKPIKKGLKSMIKEALTGKSFEEKLLEVVTDYNKECAK
jgi:hypothetical protein